jgi:hypothetical protein
MNVALRRPKRYKIPESPLLQVQGSQLLPAAKTIAAAAVCTSIVSQLLGPSCTLPLPPATRPAGALVARVLRRSSDGGGRGDRHRHHGGAHQRAPHLGSDWWEPVHAPSLRPLTQPQQRLPVACHVNAPAGL